MSFLYLSIAIIAEVIATSALKASNGFSVLWPSLATIAGYAVALFFLSLTMKTIPMGIAYAIWSGAGIILISTVGLSATGSSRTDRSGIYDYWHYFYQCLF